MRPKKSSLVSGNKSNMYEKIYFSFQFKKTCTQTKKFPIANLFVQIRTFFSLQTINDRALCFSTKKSAVRVVF